MIRRCKLLFCDGEHGFGERTFPDVREMTGEDLVQTVMDLEDRSLSTLRKEAKAAGWGRHNGADYCPDCMEGL